MLYNWVEIKKTLTDYEIQLLEARFGLGIYDKQYSYRELGKLFNRNYKTLERQIKKLILKIKLSQSKDS
jgi:DNA-directed RNA polymerase sigma subunit (sigma70/sigma32)